MEIRRIVRWFTVPIIISAGIQLYLQRPVDNDRLYAWILYTTGYLFAELGWPHREAGYQICLVLQILSFTFTLSVESRRSGVNLRFWQRTPEICRLNTKQWTVTTSTFRHTYWDGYTAGVFCRSRTQQLERIAEAQRDLLDELEKTGCVRSCVRYVDGRWHGYVESAFPGPVPPEHAHCHSAPEFGRCPGIMEGDRAQFPMQIEWAKE